MKLAEFIEDGWALEDGAELHSQHPRTFWIPALWRRYLLRRGQTVKLIFRIGLRDDDGKESEEAERMWVIVRRRVAWGVMKAYSTTIRTVRKASHLEWSWLSRLAMSFRFTGSGIDTAGHKLPSASECFWVG